MNRREFNKSSIVAIAGIIGAGEIVQSQIIKTQEADEQAGFPEWSHIEWIDGCGYGPSGSWTGPDNSTPICFWEKKERSDRSRGPFDHGCLDAELYDALENDIHHNFTVARGYGELKGYSSVREAFISLKHALRKLGKNSKAIPMT